MIAFCRYRVSRAVVLAVTAALTAAEDPLLTDLRVNIGSNQREYQTGDFDDRFDAGTNAGLSFVYGFKPLAPEGTWFLGAAARAGSGKDKDNSDGLTGTFRRFMIDGMAGYAIAAPDFSMLHMEIGPYAGIGLAQADFTSTGTTTSTQSSVGIVVEGGFRIGAYLTWYDTFQIGLEGDYGLVVGRQSVTPEGAAVITVQGFSIGLGLGVRIH
jgi:hypothetical protein